MKNKRIQFIFIAVMLLVVLTFLGCKIGKDSLEEILDKNNLTAQITYFSNGGFFNEDATNVRRDIYYKENAKAFEITTETSTKVEHVEDVYAGWYTIKTVRIEEEDFFECDVSEEQADDYQIDDSSVIVQHSGKSVIRIAHYEQLIALEKDVPPLVLDQPFDFANERLAKGSKIYLATNWLPNQKVEYVLLAEDCDSVSVINKDGSTTEYANLQVVGSELFDKDGLFTLLPYELPPVETTGSTFVEYYVYEENATLETAERVTERTITRPEDGSNVKVFVKYTAGNWRVVREAKDVKTMFTELSYDYYVDRDVDCSQESAISPIMGTLKNKIRGNGHTILGLQTKVERLESGSYTALLGKLGNATITDLTFRDVTLVCKTKPITNSFVNIYLVAHAVQGNDTPTLSNLTFDGVTLDISLANGVSITNMAKTESGYDTQSWLFGGMQNDSFFQSYPTVTIENYTIIINGTTVAGDNAAV